MSISSQLRQEVKLRAHGCCEYCRIGETDETSPFHIDHIIPIKHRGTDESDNLGWSCYQCNVFKGSNMAAADPITGVATFLFNPRTQMWDEHFHINPDATLSGKTAVGRVTIEVMRMNEEPRIQYRQFALMIGEFPCL